MVRLWLLVEPMDTLPKLRVEGLALRAPAGVEVEFVEVVEAAVEATELPLALVTPAHPAWIREARRRATNVRRTRARGVRRTRESMETELEQGAGLGVFMTRQV
jgi:hypothetical protein